MTDKEDMKSTNSENSNTNEPSLENKPENKPENKTLSDFSQGDACSSWVVVTDNVMGGLSESLFTASSDGSALFSGFVSLENSGGFASVRSSGKLGGLNGYRGIRISVQGDGKEYQLRAHADTDERGHAFKHDFSTSSGEWKEIEVLFADFVLSAHGKIDNSVEPLNSATIHQLSFLIAGGQAGEFALNIRKIEAIV